MTDIDIKALRALHEAEKAAEQEKDSARAARDGSPQSGYRYDKARERHEDASEAFLAALSAALPALLDHLERAERVEAATRELCTMALPLATTPDDHVVTRRKRSQSITELYFALRAALDAEVSR